MRSQLYKLYTTDNLQVKKQRLIVDQLSKSFHSRHKLSFQDTSNNKWIKNLIVGQQHHDQ